MGVAPLDRRSRGLLVAAGAVALLGLVADVRRVKARLLVGGTAVAAACVVPYEETGVLAGLLAVGWIVFVAFGFRALDHADGLAGTVGVVTAFGVGACAAAEVMDGLAVLLSVLAAALTGFLMHNWHPARVALGACGSMFAGFVLAVGGRDDRAGQELGVRRGGAVRADRGGGGRRRARAAVRRLAGRPLLRGGPDHLAHRLRRLGLTPQGATVVLGAAAFSGVLVGVLVHMGWIAGRARCGGWWRERSSSSLGLLRVKPHALPVYPVPDARLAPGGLRTPRSGASLRVRNG